MTVGLQGAPAKFQRVMDRVLKPHTRYAANIVVFSTDWESHLSKLTAVLDSLRKADFTANPKNVLLVYRRQNI